MTEALLIISILSQLVALGTAAMLFAQAMRRNAQQLHEIGNGVKDLIRAVSAAAMAASEAAAAAAKAIELKEKHL